MEKNFDWFKEKTVYQIWPRSFCDGNGDGIGDIPGIISKLPYLHELGIELIWLSPVYKSPMDDMGYDIADYFTIDPLFGSNEDMYQLIHEAREYNIEIMMDLVVNHTSDQHLWFQEACKSRHNPYRNYYIWHDPVDGKAPTDQRSFFLPSSWTYHEATGQYYYHAFSNRQPDLNWDNSKILEEVYKIMNFWLAKGIAGFRMDVIELIGKIPLEAKFTSPKVHDLLQKIFRHTLEKREKTITVGETGGATVKDAILYSGKHNELDMVFGFEHLTVDEEAGKGKWAIKNLDFIKFKQIVTQWQTGLYKKGWNSLYLSNHDQPRQVSRFIDPQHRVAGAKMLANTLHMLQGTPYVYQGEEIGMTNFNFTSPAQFKDIEMLNFYKEFINHPEWGKERVMVAINAKGRDNARTPMQWSSDIHGGFSTANPWIEINPNYLQINVANDRASPDSIFNFYRHLIGLRKKLPIITHGNFKLLFKDDPQIFAYLRKYLGQLLLVISNFSNQDRGIEIPDDICLTNITLISSNYCRKQISRRMALAPYETMSILIDKPTAVR